jgi:hypothetical protein
MATYAKTEPGSLALIDRRAAHLTRRQRLALILLDGQRSVDEVLRQTAALGVTREDIEKLASLGLIADTAPTPIENARPAPPPDDPERARRYRAAYPIAVGITSKLGLKGFKLNLAVESANGYDGLMALLPRLREAAGEAALQPLIAALQGRR